MLLPPERFAFVLVIQRLGMGLTRPVLDRALNLLRIGYNDSFHITPFHEEDVYPTDPNERSHPDDGDFFTGTMICSDWFAGVHGRAFESTCRSLLYNRTSADIVRDATVVFSEITDGAAWSLPVQPPIKIRGCVIDADEPSYQAYICRQDEMFYAHGREFIRLYTEHLEFENEGDWKRVDEWVRSYAELHYDCAKPRGERIIYK